MFLGDEHTHTYIYVDCICIYIYCDWCHNGSQLKNPSQNVLLQRDRPIPFSPRQTKCPCFGCSDEQCCFQAQNELCTTKLCRASPAMPSTATQMAQAQALPPAQGLPQPICVCGMNWLCPEGWRFTGRQCLTERTWEPLWISVQFTLPKLQHHVFSAS